VIYLESNALLLLRRIAKDIEEIKSEVRALREAIIPEEKIDDAERRELLIRLKEIEEGECEEWKKARMELLSE